jgi:hypothetical protein
MKPEWACAQFSKITLPGLAERLRKFNVEVGLPEYPKYPQGNRVSLSNLLPAEKRREERATNQALELARDHSLLREQVDTMVAEGQGSTSPKLRLLKVAEKYAGSMKPTIFLSYPKAANYHASFLIGELEKHYHVDFYQEPDGEVIMSQVGDKIRQADFFIGIWHHEFMLPNGITYGISPWLPFEYGIAYAENKPTLIVHSGKLDETIWKRLNPETAQPSYMDVEFVPVTIPLMVNYCLGHFRSARYSTDEVSQRGVGENEVYEARGPA